MVLIFPTNEAFIVLMLFLLTLKLSPLYDPTSFKGNVGWYVSTSFLYTILLIYYFYAYYNLTEFQIPSLCLILNQVTGGIFCIYMVLLWLQPFTQIRELLFPKHKI